MRLGNSSLGSGAARHTARHTARFSLERVEMRQAGPRVVCSIVLFLAVGPSACAADRPVAAPGDTVAANTTLQSVTEAVLADASERTGVEVAELEVVESIAITWPDGSLGCPEPGMNYTMAPVPGYRIRIRPVISCSTITRAPAGTGCSVRRDERWSRPPATRCETKKPLPGKAGEGQKG